MSQYRWSFFHVALWTVAQLLPVPLAFGEESPVRVTDFMAIANVVEAQISPDGRRVCYVIAEADLQKDRFRFSLYQCGTKGGKPRQLTPGPADFSPRWSSNSRKVAFLSDREGRDQICVLDVDGGEIECLTDVNTEIENFNWSHAGEMIAFTAPRESLDSSSEKNWISMNDPLPGDQLYILDVASREVRRLTEVPGHVTGFTWSPDDTRIVFSAQASPRANDVFEQKIFIVSVGDGAVSPLVVREGTYAMPEWSPTGEYIAFESSDGPTTCFGRRYLCVLKTDGSPADFAGADLPGGVFDVDDVNSIDWDAESRALLVEKTVGLETHLYRLDLDSGNLKQLSPAGGVHSGFSFSRDRNTMTFLLDHFAKPKEVHFSNVMDFRSHSVHPLNNFLEDRVLGTVERMKWKAPDGVELEGVLVKPRGFQAGTTYPLVTHLHGGPADAFGLGFGPYSLSAQQFESLPSQVLAGLGYAVFCPNPRGSRGYGYEFRAMAHLNWGDGPAGDVLAGIDHLIELGIADPERLAIGGHCYGGYLTAYIIGQTDRFKAAIAEACISNLTSHFGTCDIPQFSLEYFDGAPWEVWELYHQQSPLTHVANIKTPILLHHGENDERVPLSQGQEMYRALQQSGVPTNLLTYKHQGHSIGRPQLILKRLDRNLAWLARWISLNKM